MKIKLNNLDVLQLTKAIRGGVVDTDKVSFLNSLIRGYNPPKWVGREETAYYLDCIKRGWGIELNSNNKFVKMLEGVGEVEKDLYNENKKHINNGGLYNDLVKRAFWGLVAIKALGCELTEKRGDFKWMKNEKTPNFVTGL